MQKKILQNEYLKNYIIKKIKEITYIEIFIITTILLLIVITIKYFGLKQTWKTIRIEIINQNWQQNYTMHGPRTPFWMSDKLKIGQKALSRTGKKIAEIIKIENYERGSEESNTYITLKVKCILNKRDKTCTYNDKYILNIGNEIDMNIDNIGIHAQILDNNVPENGYPTKYKIITVKALDLEKWYIDKISVGKKMINKSNNEVIAEILDIKTSTSKFEKHYDANGNLIKFVTNDKDLKDVTATLKVKVELIDQSWYFGGHQQIKNYNYIWFYNEEFGLFGYNIQDVKDADN